MRESRRKPRHQARLWIQIQGIESEPVLRRGDISESGVFFETDVQVGGVGTVHTLDLETFSRSHRVEVLARVVRVVAVEDLWQGPGIAGVAFELMVDRPEVREALQAVIGDIAGRRQVSTEVAGTSIRMLAISTDGMTIETDWEAGVGEVLRCEVQAPASGRRLSIAGRAVSCARAQTEDSWLVEVKFESTKMPAGTATETEAEGRTLTDAFNVLLEESLSIRGQEQRIREGCDDLVGSLDRIKLPGLLGFIELERMTGTLTLACDDEQIEVVIGDGAIVAVNGCTDERQAVEHLRAALTWDEGSFRFAVGAVDTRVSANLRPGAVILGLLREADEAAQARP